MTTKLDNSDATLYNKGWREDGSWHCLKCNTIIGKNLLGELPLASAREHALHCDGTVKKYVEKNWGPFPLKVRH